MAPVLSSPIGLALPEPDKAVKKFNLLPPEVAQKARIKHIQDRVLVGSVVFLVLLVLFGGWKFVQVHNEQNNVNNLQSNIASLNAQIPKYDLVVAANDAYTKGVARRSSVLNSAVDWPLALSNLISITPANAAVDSFNGTQIVTADHYRTGAGAHRCGHRHPIGGHRHDQPQRERSRTEPLHLRGMDQRHLRIALLRQSAAGCDDRQLGFDHLLPLHHLDHSQCQPEQECEPQMNQVREYRMPLFIAGGALVIALILWVALVSPQNSKLTALNAQSVQLQSQESTVQARAHGTPVRGAQAVLQLR